MDIVLERKEQYKVHGVEYTCPWVFLITYGQPTFEWRGAAERGRRENAERKIALFAVGRAGADMNILRQIAPPERPPLMLDGLKFQELFVWISASQRKISSQKVGNSRHYHQPRAGRQHRKWRSGYEVGGYRCIGARHQSCQD